MKAFGKPNEGQVGQEHSTEKHCWVHGIPAETDDYRGAGECHAVPVRQFTDTYAVNPDDDTPATCGIIMLVNLSLINIGGRLRVTYRNSTGIVQKTSKYLLVHTSECQNLKPLIEIEDGTAIGLTHQYPQMGFQM